MFEIEKIYFLFPLLCFIFCFGKQNKFKICIMISFLIFFISFSDMGADNLAYKNQFNLIKEGLPLNEIHGEILFKQIMRGFANIGLDYEAFRIIFLSSLYIILGFSLSKLSVNFSISLYIFYTTYLIYLCSAYRQFFVMVILFYSFYLEKKNLKNMPIYLSILSLFIHISGIIGVIYFVILKFKKKDRVLNKIQILNIFILTLVSSFLVKLFKNIYFLLAKFLGRENQLEVYIDFNRDLFSIGMISRVGILMIFIYFFNLINENQEIKKMFIFYFIGVLVYILVPSELIAGRLSNNARMIEVIIIPYIIFKGSLNNKLIKLVGFVIYGLVILYYQLKMQNGYFPYINFIF